ncbi:YbhB/YbcL family Raf kinase inhibitor-like protein [Caballeronia grimmiae]|uniref:YbhB/YbcL family Raf kinase inhibitor-like protein n=2 Tax=Caballeronia grimmiae TaxID=1071679 RepID=UPI00094E0B82|nr:YbhB/YbcL family Raf kinase inhibitor-like protein [Caballeronia grimmiae]
MKTIICGMSLAACASMSIGAQAGTFSVWLPSLQDGQLSDAQFSSTGSCTGRNLSPAVRWTDPPAGTQSLTLTINDIDARTGFGWWHWAVANISPNVNTLQEGAGVGSSSLPRGAEMVRNDAGAPRFGGVCPPEGTRHRYRITVTALSVPYLELPEAATPAMMALLSSGFVLGRAETIATATR